MNSVIDAQLDFGEQVALEMERCKDPVYFYETYFMVEGKKYPFIGWWDSSGPTTDLSIKWKRPLAT